MEKSFSVFALFKSLVTLKVKAVQWETKWKCTTIITHRSLRNIN